MRGFDGRALRLLTLTGVTGLVDAVAFLGLGQLFCAMQTGNVVFLGLGLAGAEHASVAAPLTALCAFVAGGAGAALVLRGAGAGGRVGGGAPGVGAAVAAEIALLALATAFAAALAPRAGDDAALLTVAALAAAMGLRTTVVRRRGAPNLASTVLNLTVLGGPGDALAGSADLVQRAAALTALLLGALVGGLLLEAALWLPLALATALTLTTHLFDRRDLAPAA